MIYPVHTLLQSHNFRFHCFSQQMNTLMIKLREDCSRRRSRHYREQIFHAGGSEIIKKITEP